MNKNVIILGAGITGLVTAWKLAKAGYNVKIIEKENYAGGLSGTINWDGWKFDFGAHNFYTKHDEIVEFYKTLLPGKFRERKISVKLYVFNKIVSFPLLGSQVFLKLNVFLMAKAFTDFFFTRLRALLFGIKKTEHLDEWIIRRFGKVLYKLYFGPYLERIQKKDPHLLSSDIGEKKIPVFSIRQYILRELLKKKYKHPDDIATLKTYYIKEGYGEFSKYFLDELGKMNNAEMYFGESVVNIGYEAEKLTSIITDKRTFNASESDVISTIPVELLIKTSDNLNKDLIESSKSLEYTKMRFLLVKVKKEKVTGFSWVNFNEKDFPFYRVNEEVCDEFNMVPENNTALTFELPLNEDDPLWTIPDTDLLDLVIKLYNRVFVLKKEDVTDFKSIYQNNANPRMSIGYRKSLSDIFEFINKTENLYSLGRQGLFTYVNLDGCTKMAIEFSGEYQRQKGKSYNLKLLNDFHKINLNNHIK